MRELISQFPQHITQALADEVPVLPNLAGSIHEVVVAGLGGSGIGGKVISQWLSDTCPVPILVVNDYRLPKHVDADSLVILCSYSGNTEETLSVFEEARIRGVRVAAITSGGQLKKACDADDIPYLTMPGGNPPRSMFAWSSVKLISLLGAYGLVNGGYKALLAGIANSLSTEQDRIEGEALDLARKLIDKVPVIYTHADYEGVAVRWRQQINENGKMLCWHHVFPELNHNEFVGWEGGSEQIAVVMLRSSLEHPRTRIRMDLSKGIFARKTTAIYEVQAEGESALEQIYHLVHFGDWVSLHIAELTGTDPVDIRNIDYLKNELAAIR